MDAQLRAMWVEAFGDPEKCAALLRVLEILLPSCEGDDQVNMLQAINGLRSYAAIMFPERPELADTAHLH